MNNWDAAVVRLLLNREENANYLRSAILALGSPRYVEGLPTLSVGENWVVYAGEAALKHWPIDTLAAGICHEVWHLLGKHGERSDAKGITREQCERANTAQDIEIHDELLPEFMVAALKRTLPDIETPEAHHLPPGKLWEWYFDHLPSDPSDAPGEGSGTTGFAEEWEVSGEGGLTAFEQEALRQQVARDIAEAARGDFRGRLPAGVRRFAAMTLTPPRVPWQQVLATRMRSALARKAGSVDYSRMRPSRREEGRGVILSSLRAPDITAGVVVDTSGSMREEQLARALREVHGIANASGVPLWATSCDTTPSPPCLVTDPRQLQLIGGGGTDMGAGIDVLARLPRAPSVIVVLTDCETGWPEVAPIKSSVIVCAVEACERAREKCPPWATVVSVDS